MTVLRSFCTKFTRHTHMNMSPALYMYLGLSRSTTHKPRIQTTTRADTPHFPTHIYIRMGPSSLALA